MSHESNQIMVACFGTRGDVEPFIAIAESLHRSGKKVSVAADAIFEPLVTGRGISFSPMCRTCPDELREMTEPYLRRPYGERAFFLGDWFNRKRNELESFLRTEAGAAETLIEGPMLAQRSRTTRLHRNRYIGLHVPLAPCELMNMGPAKGKFLAMPPPLQTIPLARAGFVPTGFWRCENSPEHPPAGLQAFIEAGSPPAVLTLGSMMVPDPLGTTSRIVSLLREEGIRVIVQGGWAGLSSLFPADDVIVVKEVSHDWLFPRASLVIHHGGSGTTASALKAGVPMIIMPQLGDQLYWAQVAGWFGVSPGWISSECDFGPDLIHLIRKLSSTISYKIRATQLRSLRGFFDGANVTAQQIVNSISGQ